MKCRPIFCEVSRAMVQSSPFLQSSFPFSVGSSDFTTRGHSDPSHLHKFDLIVESASKQYTELTKLITLCGTAMPEAAICGLVMAVYSKKVMYLNG